MKVAARVVVWTFVVALCADLLTKAFAIGRVHVIYNDKPGELVRRLLMSVLAVAVVVVLTRLAAWRGLGRIWGAWFGVGLLVGGIAGNGLSRLIWERGVPDFIDMGPQMWNLADFMIGLGLMGGIISIAVSAVLAFTRYRLELHSR
jgi:lipoprotein signal peptidase